MKTFAQIEGLYVFKKVTYYSVRIEDAKLNELEKFIKRYEKDKEVEEDFGSKDIY